MSGKQSKAIRRRDKSLMDLCVRRCGGAQANVLQVGKLFTTLKTQIDDMPVARAAELMEAMRLSLSMLQDAGLIIPMVATTDVQAAAVTESTVGQATIAPSSTDRA